MVKLVDLEEEALEGPTLGHSSRYSELLWRDDRPNLNHSLKLSLVLSTYPIVSELVQYVDLNTLYEVARTCRQLRADLLQHAALLKTMTLHCVNETVDPSHRLGDALSASVEQWKAAGRSGIKVGRVSGGKVSRCVRDMVGECRRCGDISCRNCVVKTPSEREIKNRLRRLCRTCMKAPLHRLATISMVGTDNQSVTDYWRGPCTCEQEGVWICQPCGQMFRSVDTTYLRGWAWRSRYSACGGVGAGLGEGNEGVECGRGGDCLNVREIENEIECDAEELAAMEAEMEKREGPAGRQWKGNSYTTHEIVGLGGKVKKKIKKIVPVGAIVKEYEDERVGEKVLRREQEGANRSWCGWCSRVVPGKKDVAQVGESSDSVASTASTMSLSGRT